MTRVKICGITNYGDARTAVDSGADALGFIFAKSPRQVKPEQARDIIMRLPPLVKTVGVFVDEDNRKIADVTEYCGLDNVQLHGNEGPETCSIFMPRTIKAIKMKDNFSIEHCTNYNGTVKAFLLDTYSKNAAGGTGKTFNWDMAIKVKELGIPVILAGGISPSNVKEAIERVDPYAVDINSGVEKSPGKKDRALIREIFEKLKK